MRTQRVHSVRRRWWILALVLVAEAMDMLDGTIVNVAAPSIARSMQASPAALQWIVGGYALAFAVGLVTGGRLGDIYGRKRMFVFGTLAFVAASLICACAVTDSMLIFGRLAQGGAAAVLIPQGLGIIKAAFPAQQQAAAFGLFGPVIGMSAMLGPILGGVLIDADVLGTGWRMVFLVNLPLGLVAAVAAAVLMTESRAPRRPTLDLVGTVLLVAATGLLIYPLIQGREAGWPAWTYLMAGGSVVVFLAMMLWTRRMHAAGRDGLVELSVFTHRGYNAGLVLVVAFFTGMTGTLLVLTLFLQQGAHYTPVHAGLTLAPFATGSAIGAVLTAAILLPRLGRTTLQLACLVQAVGIGWLYLVIHTHGLTVTSWQLLGPQLVFGAGIGMLVVPLFDFALATIRDAEAGSASGVLNAVQQLAGAIGVAAIGTVYFGAASDAGLVVALTRCLLIVAAGIPVLFALTFLLPRQARPTEHQTAGPPVEVLPVVTAQRLEPV